MTTRIYPPARQLLAQQPVFLDTETTGLAGYDEVIEIAVIDHRGAILLDELIRATVKISYHAHRVHGITEAQIATARPFQAIWPALWPILKKRPVVIYNQAFDLRLLRQSAAAHRFPIDNPARVHCAMAMYREFNGQASLSRAAETCGIPLPPTLHRAAADAELTRRLVYFMAGLPGTGTV